MNYIKQEMKMKKKKMEKNEEKMHSKTNKQNCKHKKWLSSSLMLSLININIMIYMLFQRSIFSEEKRSSKMA